ncbi:MAG: RNA polymerase II mediator complex subunit [Alyxoria varia]|nr:MAG: RNA polymerase II mediator complex subunit [Alyxoria varia]
MADKLTQIQDCLDQFATQLYACLYYISEKNTPAQVQGQPYQHTTTAAGADNATANVNGVSQDQQQQQTEQATQQQQQLSQDPTDVQPDPPETFQASLRELAQDLVVKQQQIEMLARSLPGVTRSEAAQMERLRELEGELKAVEMEYEDVQVERENMVKRVDEKIMSVSRIY